jgi:uncharacterized protein HemY
MHCFGSMNSSLPPPVDQDDPVGAVLRRVRKAISRGDVRKSIQLARSACNRTQEDPRLWCHYGHLCEQNGDTAEAVQAYKRASFLRQKKHDRSRARVTLQLAERAAAGTLRSGTRGLGSRGMPQGRSDTQGCERVPFREKVKR